MKAEEIVAWKRRQPFVPFALHCRDGTVYEVYDPNYVMPLKNDMVVGPQNRRRIPHHAVFVNYDTVVAIKPVAELATGTNPGRDTPPNT